MSILLSSKPTGFLVMIAELQDRINRLDEEASNIYNEEHLQEHPYKLHAVLVHEGQAASGKVNCVDPIFS